MQLILKEQDVFKTAFFPIIKQVRSVQAFVALAFVVVLSFILISCLTGPVTKKTLRSYSDAFGLLSFGFIAYFTLMMKHIYVKVTELSFKLIPFVFDTSFLERKMAELNSEDFQSLISDLSEQVRDNLEFKNYSEQLSEYTPFFLWALCAGISALICFYTYRSISKLRVKSKKEYLIIPMLLNLSTFYACVLSFDKITRFDKNIHFFSFYPMSDCTFKGFEFVLFFISVFANYFIFKSILKDEIADNYDNESRLDGNGSNAEKPPISNFVNAPNGQRSATAPTDASSLTTAPTGRKLWTTMASENNSYNETQMNFEYANSNGDDDQASVPSYGYYIEKETVTATAPPEEEFTSADQIPIADQQNQGFDENQFHYPEGYFVDQMPSDDQQYQDFEDQSQFTSADQMFSYQQEDDLIILNQVPSEAKQDDFATEDLQRKEQDDNVQSSDFIDAVSSFGNEDLQRN